MAFYSTTLAVMRQRLSSAVGDLIMGTFNTGTTSTGVDGALYNPKWANDYFNNHGYKAYIYQGTYIGYETWISDWDLATTTLTFSPAFSTAVDATSKYELHRVFTEDDYRKAINGAIEFLADDYLLDAVYVNTTLATETYEYAMPISTEFQYVHRITKETASGGAVFADVYMINPDFYKFTLVGDASYLKFDEGKYKIPSGDSGKDLRIEGQKRQAALTSDTSICYLPPDFIIAKAITLLPYEKIQSNNLDRTLEIAINSIGNIPYRTPYPSSKRVVL